MANKQTAAKTKRKKALPAKKKNNLAAGDWLAQTLEKYQKTLVIFLVLAAAIIGVITWYYRVYSTPENVFWGAVSNSLATKGVTREINSPTCLLNNSASHNIIQFSVSPDRVAHCLTIITDASLKPPARVTVESIATDQADYVRYAKIERAGSSTAKYSKVYDMWIKNGGNANAQPEVLTRILFGPMLFGDLPPEQRQKVLNELSSAYKVDFNTVKTSQQDGRRQYKYNVSLVLNKFAQAALDYARALKLSSAGQINPANYRQNDTLEVTFNIDVMSRELRTIDYPSASESFSGYGISKRPATPAHTVPPAQLQKILTNITK